MVIRVLVVAESSTALVRVSRICFCLEQFAVSFFRPVTGECESFLFLFVTIEIISV